MMVLMVARTLPDPGLESNYRGPHFVPQSLAVVRLEPGRRNGRSHEEPDRPRPQTPRAFGQDIERVVDVDRHDGHLCGDSQREGRVLERQELSGGAPRAFGEN